MLDRPFRLPLGLIFTASLVPLLASCQGGGKHTGELKTEAMANMAKVRAAADYDLAAQQFETGNLQLALQAVDNALEAIPDSSKGHLLRGRILLEMGPADPALEAFDAGIAQTPEEPQLHYCRGIALERMDRHEEALAAYLEARQLAPNHPEYLLAGMEEMVDLGRVDDALSLVAQQPFEVRNHPGVKQLLGHIALMRGQSGTAIDAFTQAVVLSPDDPVLREDLCRALLSELRFAEAETHLQFLSPTAHYQRRNDLKHMHAACLLELNRPVEARQILLAITREGTGAADYDAWLRLVDVALVLDEDSLLRQAATRLIGIAPERHDGHLALALWQRRNGDLQGALKTLVTAERYAQGDQTPTRLRQLVEHDLAGKTSG